MAKNATAEDVKAKSATSKAARGLLSVKLSDFVWFEAGTTAATPLLYLFIR
jgi:hypothetical protein